MSGILTLQEGLLVTGFTLTLEDEGHRLLVSRLACQKTGEWSKKTA